jgi:hypothetical protein
VRLAWWSAGLVDVDAGNSVQVVPVQEKAYRIVLAPWNSTASWYNPRLHDASFFLLPDPFPGCPAGFTHAWEVSARAAFGPQSRTYSADGFLVLTWHQNLLRAHQTWLPPARPAAC